MRLRDYVVMYATHTGIAGATVSQLTFAVQSVENFTGEYFTTAQLGRDKLNAWIEWLESKGYAPNTVRSRRRMILTLWRAAHEEGLASVPKKLRRVSCPDRPPVAWTMGEMQQLVATAHRLKRRIRGTSLTRANFYESLFRAQFDSALRISDLLALDVRRLAPDGRIALTQAKTGRVHLVQFQPLTMAAIARSVAESPQREKIWPTRLDRRSFFKAVKRIVAASGVRAGTSKMIRRSSASYVEKQTPGTAWRHLGHSRPGCDVKHYLDPLIVAPAIPRPPELGA